VQLAAYSNVGAATVHLAAPGSGILSTWPENSYKLLSGTSMAAPFVSGAAALLVSATGGKLPMALLRQALLESAKPLSCLSGSVATGGMLDIAAALQHAMELVDTLSPPPASPSPPPPPPPKVAEQPDLPRADGRGVLPSPPPPSPSQGGKKKPSLPKKKKPS
jgi:subtilisin family serine protease